MNREKLTDEELIIAIRNGDNIATNVLLERYKTTVKKISRKLFLTNGNIEDLVQEGMIGVFDAINSYRSDNKEATFKTYAYTCIQRRIFSAIRSSKTNKNKPLEYYISLSVDSNMYTKIIKYKSLAKFYLNIKKINKNSISSISKNAISGSFSYIPSTTNPNYTEDLSNATSGDSYKRIMLGFVVDGI